MISTRNLILFAFFCELIASCATIDGPARRNGLSYQANKSVDSARDRGLTPSADPDERISIDKSMDKYRSTPIQVVDDKTGKTLVICRWMKPKGTLFSKKVCATPEEFEAMRKAHLKEWEDFKYKR